MTQCPARLLDLDKDRIFRRIGGIAGVEKYDLQGDASVPGVSDGADRLRITASDPVEHPAAPVATGWER